MKIDTTIVLKTLSGEVVKNEQGNPATLGQTIAGILTAPSREEGKFDHMKSFVLAQDLYTKNEVDIDTADFAKLNELLKGVKGYSSLIIGQILTELSKVAK